MSEAAKMLSFAAPETIAAALPRVLQHLQNDGLIAYPTETVYGFGGPATPAAVAALRALKERDAEKPFLLLVADVQSAPGVQWSETAARVAGQFWPGPLTLVLPATARAFPPGVIGEDGTVAVRASPHAAVQTLVRAWGAPLTSTSANAPGQPPARSGAEAAAALAALQADDVLVLDGGALPASLPSTVVSCANSRVRVLREGAVSVMVLKERLQRMGIDVE